MNRIHINIKKEHHKLYKIKYHKNIKIKITGILKFAFFSLIKYLTISVCSHNIAKIKGVGPLIFGILEFFEVEFIVIDSNGKS